VSVTTDIAVLMQQRSITDSRVTTRVGERFRPQALDQSDAMPAIRYELFLTEDWGHLDGASGEAQSRVQFDCCADTQLEANDVAELMEDLWNGFVGYLGADDQVRVFDCTVDNKWDTIEAAAPGSDQRRYIRKIDFVITHSKPIPSLTVVTA
jgi:hypothetical protein